MEVKERNKRKTLSIPRREGGKRSGRKRGESMILQQVNLEPKVEEEKVKPPNQGGDQ